MNSNTLFAESILKEHSLWANHPSTPTQRNKHGRKTQRDVLASLLREAQRKGAALELPEIMRSGIAQHGARFAELRKRGFVVENELDRDSRGIVRSRYWLRHDPEQDGQP